MASTAVFSLPCSTRPPAALDRNDAPLAPVRRPVRTPWGWRAGSPTVPRGTRPRACGKSGTTWLETCLPHPATDAKEPLMHLLPGPCVRRVAAPDMADGRTPVAGPNGPVADRGTPE